MNKKGGATQEVFHSYSQYYDLLYKDKDYAGEVDFVERLIKRYAPDSKSVLDLGCGTGNHCELLAKNGLQVHGMDRSAHMLQEAEKKLVKLPKEIAGRLSFSQGEICNFNLNRQFDVITAFFHVISYLGTNEELQACFKAVKSHLRPNGIFIFDYWYGPAVLSAGVATKVKRYRDKQLSIIRNSESQIRPEMDVVDVHFQLLVRDLLTDSVREISEVHRMRYLFQSEIDSLLRNAQMIVVENAEWMTAEKPSESTWGVYSVARA